ncbi:hypothetical protein PFDG_05212 [Plasmodium falciparum Dd2]|uniref:Uncharacterized protein n=1 Tax=Plasmodium falciparum (isolate Dd2) TaxID=57267 RepID=A0A0L7M9X6_PLAF4|nr:hypothetical protein PFDG_05212 [Plasmodium falciparum Dd2]
MIVYPYINNSEILKLPDIKELNNPFNKHFVQTQDGHWDFYLQILRWQINFYHVMSSRIYDIAS